ncbi:hypothetical protein EDB81DRAFT_688564 [Dactylonectria macrodidyma]|uniref:Uncharacterized protein n=1 Tax=Dactylonectria macrodidyma TaxID=307937 RepID=A0A9P9EZ24_9HYPO|nr:hypothetical protein EDB81DRAFT_688564 [Dactylonectria macrodidyma]
MASPLSYSDDLSLNTKLAGQRQFKKHKVLPRPHHDRGHEPVHAPRVGPKNYDLIVETSRPNTRDDSRGRNAQPSSPRTLKHQPRRIGSGPDLPPTPPRHSRKSSSNSSGLPSSPIIPDAAFQTPRNAPDRPPATPPNQRSPPTPDVTPPQQHSRPGLLRPVMSDRAGSRATTADSQSGSFRTAREEAFSSEDDEKKSAGTKTSLSTVRKVPENKAIRTPKLNGLGLALASIAPPEVSGVARSEGDFSAFDGDWSSVSEVEQEWDYNLLRMVTIKKRPQVLDTARPGSEAAIVIDPDMVPPTQAAKAVRHMPLHKKTDTISSARGVSDRGTTSTAPSSTGTSMSSDPRRASAISTKSTVSTVVEAILVDGPPQRQRTLRHVRKQGALRGRVDTSPSSTTNSLKSEAFQREPRGRTRPQDGKYGSVVSNTTVRSISSGKARREVWKNGGIPVVIVPDRLSSNKPRSREPSLRSHSSKRSNRSPSAGSAPLDVSSVKEAKDTREVGPTFSRQSRRSRAYSESDGSDQRTIDFPPSVPARSSSLSAPTSRNASQAGSRTGSRAGSLTAESMQMHNALQESLLKKADIKPQAPVVYVPEGVTPRSIFPIDPDNEWHRRSSSDRHSGFLLVKSYGSLKTPFSLASMETNGTALEVSEAFAVQMYPHQNSSVLMVDHSAKPSQSSIETPKEPETVEMPTRPKITLVDPSGNDPVTPPQPQFSLDDVDSPLRNPRAPPEPPSHPPAINLIPATPSEKPGRYPSRVRRAFSRHRRRHSVDYPPTAPRSPGFLTRTFSLSRHMHSRHGSSSRDREHADFEREPTYPSPEDSPAEEDRLHPFWRPQWCDDEECDGSCQHHRDEFEEDDVVYRYPPVNNRPQRNLSARMKRTFAILPPRDENRYIVDDWHGPERRTIRRTPSGNLRVMRHRASFDSLRRNFKHDEEIHAVSDGEEKRPFWRRNSMHRRASKERRRLSLGSKLEEIQNIPRKISEKRREKRTRELRQKISGPREVRDGVGEVIRSSTFRDQHHAANGRI